MIISETCVCGARTEAPAMHTDALDFLERWRADHRCTQPSPAIPVDTGTPMIAVAEEPADIGFRLQQWEES